MNELCVRSVKHKVNTFFIQTNYEEVFSFLASKV
jgi:hypothetical protein